MDCCTERQLRRLAEGLGCPVSGRQFRDLREAGLVPPPGDDNRWPVATVDRLVAVQRLGRDPELRMLDRRAIRLAAQGDLIPPERLVEAVQSVLRKMTSPQRKLERVSDAGKMLSPPGVAVNFRPDTARDRALLPKRADWAALVASFPPDHVAKRLVWACYFAGATRPMGMDPLKQVDGIPLEEVAVLMLVLDLHRNVPPGEAG